MLGEVMMQVRNELLSRITNGTILMGMSNINNIADTTCDITDTEHVESDESAFEQQDMENIQEEVLKARKIVSAQRKAQTTLESPRPLSTQKTLASYFTKNPR